MKKILFALLCAAFVASQATAAVNKPTADSVCCSKLEQIPVPTPTPTPDKKGHYS